MILYEYLDPKGRGVLTEWRKTRQSSEKASLDTKLETLQKVDDPDNQLPGLLEGSGEKNRKKKSKHIFKLQIGGKIRLRPMVCRGPADPKREITVLCPAVELDGKLEPRNAPEISEQRRQEILADPSRRRRYDYPE